MCEMWVTVTSLGATAGARPGLSGGPYLKTPKPPHPGRASDLDPEPGARMPTWGLLSISEVTKDTQKSF
jgi:hypothetical protein